MNRALTLLLATPLVLVANVTLAQGETATAMRRGASPLLAPNEPVKAGVEYSHVSLGGGTSSKPSDGLAGYGGFVVSYLTRRTEWPMGAILDGSWSNFKPKEESSSARLTLQAMTLGAVVGRPIESIYLFAGPMVGRGLVKDPDGAGTVGSFRAGWTLGIILPLGEHGFQTEIGLRVHSVDKTTWMPLTFNVLF
jgi:hypothetical protein